MALDTSLNISGLDFETIRLNLRNFLASKPEFTDFDFNDAAIGTLLDLLAYNTYYMAYYANMAANEGFIDTAQLYESVVSRAKALGYLPYSNQGATANVLVSFTAPVANSTLRTITIAKNTQFTTTINAVSYSFVTPRSYTIGANSTNGFSSPIDLVEGSQVVQSFVYTAANTAFVLPNINTDIRSISVSVSSGGNTQTYNQASDLLSSNSSSQIYFIEADRGKKYKISFGDGVLGNKPQYNSTVQVSYRVSNGKAGNGARTFTAVGSVGGYNTFTLSTITPAYNGADAEGIESVRFNAPKTYTVQSRAVITSDYQQLILRDNTDLKAVSVWGGEDNSPPIYGKIFVAVIPNSGTLISEDRKTAIISQVKKYNMQSIGVNVVDPTYLYIIPTVSVRYDPSETSLEASEIVAAVANQIISYESTALDRFEGKFRFSQFLRTIDAADGSIVASSAIIRGQKRFVASTTSATSYTINFNSAIYHPFDGNAFAVSSSAFTYAGVTAYFDDDGFGKIRIFTISPENTRVYLNNTAGTVNYTTGVISITSFFPTSIADAEGEISVNVLLDSPNVSPIRNQVLLISDATVAVYNDNTGALEFSQTSINTIGQDATLLQTSTSSLTNF